MSEALRGKVAVITGASTGIGFAIASQFAAAGASVVMAGRRQAELDAAVKAIGGEAIGVCTDVSTLHGIDALFDVVGQSFGRVDVLVANAGGGSTAPLGEITEEQFDKTFATNVKGV
jgi:NAD(P)-dependent dehydrogenase (short-subunit alcohol dehydrogenase family)